MDSVLTIGLFEFLTYLLHLFPHSMMFDNNDVFIHQFVNWMMFVKFIGQERFFILVKTYTPKIISFDEVVYEIEQHFFSRAETKNI